MDELFRKRAEVFAEMASVPDLAKLEEWQKVKLVADVRAAEMLKSPLNVSRTASGEPVVRYTDTRLTKLWGNSMFPPEWLPIVNAHEWAHRLINEMLDSGRADVSRFQRRLPRPTEWKLDASGRVRPIYDALAEAYLELLPALDEVINAGLFPFRRCGQCKKVFVRAGKKKYCSKKCTDEAVGSRNDYMRDYMRERRRILGREEVKNEQGRTSRTKQKRAQRKGRR